jgi:hypothetical protein
VFTKLANSLFHKKGVLVMGDKTPKKPPKKKKKKKKAVAPPPAAKAPGKK